MLLINKKNIATMFAGISLLSASSLGGVNALAAGEGTDNNPQQTTTSAGANKDAIGQIDDKGNATANKNMPNANANSNTSNATQANISGRSDAHINVVNGYLVLETVPSLGFEDVTGQKGDTKSNKVQNNQTVLTSDSFFKNANQNPTDLYVLDARNGNIQGYAVDAKLGKFGTYQNGATAEPDSSTVKDGSGNLIDQESKPFTLNLSGVLNQAPSDGSSKVTDNASLKSDDTNSQTVLLNNANKASGATKVSFGDNSNNSGGKTTLDVPEGIAGGQYAAPITWTLTAGTSGKSLN